MEAQLAEEGYVGCIDLHCVVNQWHLPLELTARFDYPAISIQQERILTPISDFFWELASGQGAEMPHAQRLSSWHPHRRAAVSV